MRSGPHHIGTKGAADGNVLVYRKATDEYGPEAPPASGVATVVAGAGVTVDSTDPAHPIVSSTTTSASRGELLMADGVTSPPVPIETEAGDDWLYQD